MFHWIRIQLSIEIFISFLRCVLDMDVLKVHADLMHWLVTWDISGYTSIYYGFSERWQTALYYKMQRFPGNSRGRWLSCDTGVMWIQAISNQSQTKVNVYWQEVGENRTKFLVTTLLLLLVALKGSRIYDVLTFKGLFLYPKCSITYSESWKGFFCF